MRRLILVSVLSTLLGASITALAQEAHWKLAINKLGEAISEASHCEKNGALNVRNCASGRQQAVALMKQAQELLISGQGR